MGRSMNLDQVLEDNAGEDKNEEKVLFSTACQMVLLDKNEFNDTPKRVKSSYKYQNNNDDAI